MMYLQGTAASSGIAIAKAYRLESSDLSVEKKEVSDVRAELQHLDASLEKAKGELEKIKEHAGKELGEDKAAIFAAHLLVLNDPE